MHKRLRKVRGEYADDSDDASMEIIEAKRSNMEVVEAERSNIP